MLMGAKAVAFCVAATALQTAPPASDASATAPAQADLAAPTVPASPSGYTRLPANTAVDFEIADVLTSKTSKIDEMFKIRLVDPVTVDGVLLLPAGTMGEGQIVHAARARALGKAGELILAARYFSCGDTRIALRGFHLGHSGKNSATELTVAIAAIGAVALPLMFVSGGESVVPYGTRANARLTSAVDVRVGAGGQCSALPVATTEPATSPAPVSAAPAALPLK